MSSSTCATLSNPRVTATSGRGVGLDLVRSVVDEFDELQSSAAHLAAQEAADLQQKARNLILVLSGLAVLIREWVEKLADALRGIFGGPERA